MGINAEKKWAIFALTKNFVLIWLSPHLHNLLDNLCGSKVLSKLNFKNAHFYIPVRHQDRPKKAFVSKLSAYEFTCSVVWQ